MPHRTLAILLPLALTACATPASYTADGPQGTAARIAYRACAGATMATLQGTSRPDAAAQVAGLAVAQCERERLTLRDAVEADSTGPQARRYAETYSTSYRQRLVADLAAGMLRSR